jgi:ribose transport system substrate-binding protein
MKRLLILCMAALTSGLLLASCGGDNGNGGGQAASGAVDEASGVVADAEKPITKGPSAPPFDASSTQGKKIWFVSPVLSIDYSQQILRGVEEGARALGAEVRSFDADFSPTEVSRGIDLAIQDGADAIIVHSIPAEVVAPAIAKAHAAGIKIISAEIQNPGPPLPGTPDTVDAIAGHSYSIPTRTMAAKVIQDSGGDANVLFFSASDIGPGSKQGTDTFVATMEEWCPDCPVEVVDSPVGQWSGLTQRIASLLRAKPDVNYVVPIFDGMATYMIPGIQSAGAVSKVKLVSGDATPSVLEDIKSGDVAIGDVGQPNVWTGVAIMDQTARVFAGVKPLDDVGIQYRLFTENNVQDLDLKGDPTAWYGDVDFLGDYETIWGIK